MRIFIGIKVKAPTKLATIRQHISEEHNKWVKEHNFHLTLVFIGQAQQQDLKKISAALKNIVRSHAPFNFIIKGAGTFQKRRSSGVLWLGVENSETLNKLKDDINRTILQLMPSLKPQHMAYTPHITVARLKNKDLLTKYRQLLEQANISTTQSVSEVILYESVSAPNGVEYNVLEKFKLSAIN
ncbi:MULTISPECIES: RNA 2',3'-cyclic phosphodiesterase [unclassified Saccharicrinis]|uniref:RNA 2',3'-cyclic phosphodiesterase n=1 Tax=unclassified Saccharicrinis TaxID=2646859 RepID=UPI003D330A4E